MHIAFTKMHGVGNDFAVIDARREEFQPHADLIRRMANRRTGIGFDQALILEAPRRPETEVYYRIFNADGDEVEQCGNGARCIASLLHAETSQDSFTLDSPGGLIQARAEPDDRFAVAMGIPNFDPESLPFEASHEALTYTLELGHGPVEIGAVSIGNPHAVIATSSAPGAAVGELGPEIERHPRFPQRVNVGFMEIVERDHIRLRVHERGSGETLACGTGACAAVAVGVKRGKLREKVRVDLPGGRLMVSWGGDGASIWLTGPAEKVFEGHIEL